MVSLLPSDEQQQIIDSIAAFLRDELPIDRLRKASGAKARSDRDAWPQIVELGWLGLGLPERIGGVGYTLAEEALLMRECGRVLLTPSLMATILACHVAARANARALYKELLTGGRRAALAMPRDHDDLRGGPFYLLDGGGTDILIAWNASGCALYDRNAFNGISAVPGLDDTLTLETGTLAAGEPLAWVPAEVKDYGQRASVMLAAMMVGLSEAVRDMATEYAKVRQQFGQPIGAFQAVKHHCADMAVRSEAASCQMVFAAITVQAAKPDATFQSSAAKILATNAAILNASANIQVHGGIGFTDECDAHRYLKRAHTLDIIGGSIRQHQARLLAEPAPF